MWIGRYMGRAIAQRELACVARSGLQLIIAIALLPARMAQTCKKFQFENKKNKRGARARQPPRLP